LAIASRMESQYRGMNVAIRNANDGISLAQTADSGLAVVGDMLQRMRELAVQAKSTTLGDDDYTALDKEYQQLAAEINRSIDSVKFNDKTLLAGSNDFDFQVGASNDDASQLISIAADDLNLAAAAADGGVNDVTDGADGSTGSGATELTDSALAGVALDAIEIAIQNVSNIRATLGAIQNRFNYTISFLQSASENQQAARGRIMDADFAVETANLSRAQILKQAGTAMVAQANQLPQGVLALLR